MATKKNDRRVKYTKMVLRQSLLELMKTRPLNKITVTDICQQADINRGTFYSHYADPYDLLEQIEAELLDEIKASIERSLQVENISTLLAEIFQTIQRNSDLCKTLFSEFGDKEFLKRILYIAHDRSVQEWKASAGGAIPQEQLEWMYTFTANGSIGIIQEWVQGGMHQDVSKIAGFIERISERGMRAFFEVSQEKPASDNA